MRNYQYDPGEATLPAEPTFTEEDRERVRQYIVDAIGGDESHLADPALDHGGQ